MKHSTISRLFGCFAAMALTFGLSASLSAQSYKGSVGDPQVEVLPSPQISAGIGKKFKPKDWLELESQIKVTARKAPKSGYIDEVTVKWYVLVADPQRRGNFLKLTKVVNHMNLPVGEEVYASVYLSPATLRKMTGKSKVSARVVEAFGVEVLVNGELIGSQGEFKGKKKWWKMSSDKLRLTENYKLLDKSQTPFAALWWDRYLEVDKGRR